MTYLDWKHWDAASFGRCSASQGRYFGWHLKRCGDVHRALEIGFGNGAFLGYARGLGIDVQGVELEPALRERAQAMGIPAQAVMEDLPPGPPFDLVVAFDVFEHLDADRLGPLLQQVHARLAPAGRLLCRVPNGDSPFGLKHQNGDASHRAAYGLDQLVQLAEPAGLRLVAQGEAPWHAMPDRKRNLSNLSRAAVAAVLEGAVRYAYRWPRLQLGPNLVAVFAPGPQAS